jgi:hypothetical protein
MIHLIELALAAAVARLAYVRVRPFRGCRRCQGRGCSRCGGSGQVRRLGARLAHKAGTRTRR